MGVCCVLGHGTNARGSAKCEGTRHNKKKEMVVEKHRRCTLSAVEGGGGREGGEGEGWCAGSQREIQEGEGSAYSLGDRKARTHKSAGRQSRPHGQK